MTSMKAGAAKREIVIPEGYPAAENFRTIHDPIHARALAIEANVAPGADAPFALVSLELTSLPGDEVAALRQLAAEAIGCAPERVWIAATHSFSSPHLMPDHMLKTDAAIRLKGEYRRNLQNAVVEAVKAAWENRREAVFGFGTEDCDIVANRDVETADGWWVGVNGEGPTDRTASVLRFDGADGKPIAMLLHFAMQSSVMDQSEAAAGGKIITSDVAGMACAELEKRLGVTALYLIGAAGDQAPVEKAVTETFVNGEKVRRDVHEAGLDICARLAGRLSDSAERAYRDIQCEPLAAMALGIAEVTVPAKRMNGDVHSLRPTRAAVYVADGERTQPIDALALGDVALLGVQPELNRVTARNIEAQSRFDRTLVCTMVNGACKYMADAASYDTFRYEALNSPWNRGAAESLADAGAKLLNDLKEGAV